MPKVARDAGLIAPNQESPAEVALLAVALLQVVPLALLRLSVKSTLPLLPAPGLVRFTVVLPLDKVLVNDSWVSQAVRLLR